MSAKADALPSQLPLELPFEQHMTGAHFFVNAANEAAHGLVTGWPQWPARTLLLTGPEGSGKTHLASIWASLAGAVKVDAFALEGFLPQAGKTYVVEDIDGGNVTEHALFHLLNASREANAWLLLTAQKGVCAGWPLLPDLASRLRAVPHAALFQSDDDLVRAVLVKQFKDRQLVVEEDVVDYVVRRMERSTAMIRMLAEALDREALSLGRRVTRVVASQVLARLTKETTGDDDERE
jgi:chromosomal replication initiation ATPase DnaA